MTEPVAADLLEIARQTLLSDLLPGLKGRQKYQALMIANAIAIAVRESRAGRQLETVEREELAVLLGGAPWGPQTQQRLCLAIRAGSFDEPQAFKNLHSALLITTEAEVQISNPKALS